MREKPNDDEVNAAKRNIQSFILNEHINSKNFNHPSQLYSHSKILCKDLFLSRYKLDIGNKFPIYWYLQFRCRNSENTYSIAIDYQDSNTKNELIVRYIQDDFDLKKKIIHW